MTVVGVWVPGRTGSVMESFPDDAGGFGAVAVQARQSGSRMDVRVAGMAC